MFSFSHNYRGPVLPSKVVITLSGLAVKPASQVAPVVTPVTITPRPTRANRKWAANNNYPTLVNALLQSKWNTRIDLWTDSVADAIDLTKTIRSNLYQQGILNRKIEVAHERDTAFVILRRI